MEVRRGQQEFLCSRLISWTAIVREIFRGFWDPEQEVFVQDNGSKTLDATCLLMPIVGLITPRGPRWLATLKAISGRPTDDSLVHRYRIGVAAVDGWY